MFNHTHVKKPNVMRNNRGAATEDFLLTFRAQSKEGKENHEPLSTTHNASVLTECPPTENTENDPNSWHCHGDPFPLSISQTHMD